MLVDGEGLAEPDAGHLPMAGGGVLAWRVRRAFAESAGGRSGRSQVCERCDAGEAEPDERGQTERARLRDMLEGAAADVAIVVGVRQGADAHAVEHYPDDAVKPGHGFPPKSSAMRCGYSRAATPKQCSTPVKRGRSPVPRGELAAGVNS